MPQQDDKIVQDCYYQTGEIFAEIGEVKRKLRFKQELTGEDRAKIKESSQKAEAELRKHQYYLAHSFSMILIDCRIHVLDGTVKKGAKAKVATYPTKSRPKPVRLQPTSSKPSTILLRPF